VWGGHALLSNLRATIPSCGPSRISVATKHSPTIATAGRMSVSVRRVYALRERSDRPSAVSRIPRRGYTQPIVSSGAPLCRPPQNF
jgi:hypothetical protein